VSDQTTCETFVRAFGNTPERARELCADRLLRRCARGLLGQSSSQDEFLDDLVACYGRDSEKDVRRV
jgi:hypothetical protein